MPDRQQNASTETLSFEEQVRREIVGLSDHLQRAERERDEAVERLAELVRLRDLKESSPQAYAEEEEGAAKAEAWHQARSVLARLHSQKEARDA